MAKQLTIRIDEVLFKEVKKLYPTRGMLSPILSALLRQHLKSNPNKVTTDELFTRQIHNGHDGRGAKRTDSER